MFIPTNEQGVIFLWGSICHIDGWVPIHLQTAYPDGIFEKDGKRYRVEFEFKAGNFILHGHDPSDCDLVICWENNIRHGFPLPIIELQSYLSSNKSEQVELPVLSPDDSPPKMEYTKKYGYRTNKTLDRILYESINDTLAMGNISHLADKYGVSRGTVYNAISAGMEDGLIKKDRYGRYKVTNNVDLIASVKGGKNKEEKKRWLNKLHERFEK